jgi:GNAT superfamily N-acetyltransferase
MDFQVRRATAADLALVMHHRREMFREMGFDEPEGMAAMEATSAPYFAEGLANGDYQGWFLTDASGKVVAGGGVTLAAYHSSPRDPQSWRAWIVNVYTEPEFRRLGLAKTLMNLMVTWCKEQGWHSVYLHASQEGRPLYEAMGFQSTNEMRLRLRA